MSRKPPQGPSGIGQTLARQQRSCLRPDLVRPLTERIWPLVGSKRKGRGVDTSTAGPEMQTTLGGRPRVRYIRTKATPRALDFKNELPQPKAPNDYEIIGMPWPPLEAVGGDVRSFPCEWETFRTESRRTLLDLGVRVLSGSAPRGAKSLRRFCSTRKEHRTERYANSQPSPLF